MIKYIVMGSLVLFLIAFAGVVMLKQKQNKSKRMKAQKNLAEKVTIARLEIATNIVKIIDKNSKLIETGQKNVSEIKKIAKESLTNLRNSSKFKLAVKYDETKILSKNVSKLTNINSTMWNKRNQELIEYFTDLKIIETETFKGKWISFDWVKEKKPSKQQDLPDIFKFLKPSNWRTRK